MEDAYFDYDYSGATHEATQTVSSVAINDTALIVAIIGISLCSGSNYLGGEGVRWC